MTQERIIRKRDRLLAQLPEARDILRGSLLERNIRHSSGRCERCDSGGGHPVSVLAIGYPGGRMHQISLRKEQAGHVKQCLENYYKLKAALEEICVLNQQLLRARPAAAGKKSRSKRFSCVVLRNTASERDASPSKPASCGSHGCAARTAGRTGGDCAAYVFAEAHSQLELCRG